MPQRGPGPSVKDPDQYEALRRQGESKEKSARIANTSRRSAGQKGGKAASYTLLLTVVDDAGLIATRRRRVTLA
jgi:hypothetical protein